MMCPQCGGGPCARGLTWAWSWVRIIVAVWAEGLGMGLAAVARVIRRP